MKTDIAGVFFGEGVCSEGGVVEVRVNAKAGRGGAALVSAARPRGRA